MPRPPIKSNRHQPFIGDVLDRCVTAALASPLRPPPRGDDLRVGIALAAAFWLPPSGCRSCGLRRPATDCRAEAQVIDYASKAASQWSAAADVRRNWLSEPGGIVSTPRHNDRTRAAAPLHNSQRRYCSPGHWDCTGPCTAQVAAGLRDFPDHSPPGIATTYRCSPAEIRSRLPYRTSTANQWQTVKAGSKRAFDGLQIRRGQGVARYLCRESHTTSGRPHKPKKIAECASSARHSEGNRTIARARRETSSAPGRTLH
jgi:hypothetical protein